MRGTTILGVHSGYVRGDRVSEALAFGIQLANTPRIQRDPSTYEIVGSLIQRASEATSEDVLIERLPALMDLPVEGRDLVTRGTDGLYFEPVRFLRTIGGESVDLPTSTVDSLVKTLSGKGAVPDVDDPEKERQVARAYAAMRLSYPYEAGVLSEREAKQFGRAYWALADSPDNVPTPYPLNVAFARHAPQPEGGPDAEERARNTLLTSLRSNQEAIRSGTVSSPGTWVYFELFWAATQSVGAKSFSIGIVWSPDEAAEILDAVAAWWDTARSIYLDELEKEQVHGVPLMSRADMLHDQLKLIPLLLTDVILPFFEVGQHDEAKEARRIVSELREVGLATAMTAPYFLRFDLSKAEAMDRIRFELHSDNTFAINIAVEAVYRWTQQHRAGIVDAPPRALIRDVLGALSARRGVGLARLALTGARILSDAPDVFVEEDLDRLTSTLNALEKVTAYPSPDTALIAPTLDEKNVAAGTTARAAVVGLAWAAKEWYNNSNLPTPAAVERWGDIAREAPLPEMRWAWEGRVHEAD